MVVVLDDVTIGAGVKRSNCRVQGRESGHQNKEGIRRNFLREFQEINAILTRHANIGNDDVEDLGFQFALGGLHAVRNFYAVPLFAKGDLQQLAD